MLRSLLAGLLLWATPALALETPLRIAAAEAAYTDIARQIVGPDAKVSTLLSNPATDPHEYEPTAAIARSVADADVIIANGLGYDAWLQHLLAASGRPGRLIIVADLLHRQPGDNPHLWFDIAAMPALAAALTDVVDAVDPAHRDLHRGRRDNLLAGLAALQARVAQLRARYAGMPVAATEPVFGLMAGALGLTDRHARYELSQMNGTEPRASDVAALQDDLNAHRVRILFSSAQRQGTATTQLLAIARAANVPVIAVAETLPAGETYQAWIGATLDEVQAVLDQPR